MSRVASARTLDGYKIRAKLALHYPKAVTMEEADATMMQYARAFAAAVEGELCNGDLPFDDTELIERLTSRVPTLPKRNVRIIGLHVWHKGAISSRSMLAVKPDQNGSPTVPAMKAMRPPAPDDSQEGPHSRSTVRPDPEREPAASRPQRRPSLPGARTSVAARRASPAHASGAQRVAAPAPAAVESPRPSAKAPTGAGMVSGMIPAAEPRIVRSTSGFLLALKRCDEGSGGTLGQALAPPVRNAAALVLFAALDACHEQLDDPLSLLEASPDDELRRKLIGEACVCVSYLLYESLAQTQVPPMQCIEVVQGACTAALRDDSMPVSEISRYLATESPREELTGRLCGLLRIRETSELQRRVESALRTLRVDVRSSAAEIEAKLSTATARRTAGPAATEPDTSQKAG